ncbi:RNA polymerase sigma factor SigJ [Cellulomonas carbonis]|uniref:RNA polymerase subunit sigma-70 n=1 Tax=Cellulomonas carbonis T26 TaxID=947969 RepID=A0A0A0BVL2_9CELL|nr:RNA polymerase sigma factor SigJ [Cellulomonas carbonis]KGM11179.1 RNA polymerase subunit sigma-70 [Cellulomonas carbonis T26]
MAEREVHVDGRTDGGRRAVEAGRAAQGRAAELEQHRRRLVGLGYRMLGSVAEAEDVVQEAWLRLAGTDDVRDVGAWATTVVSRLCLDRLRSARARREAYVGPWLPEPVLTRVEDDPAAVAERDDSVRLALLVVLERLTPEQRVALVLHDSLGIPFAEVAEVLGTSVPTARQHASRARRTVADATPPEPVAPDVQRSVVAAFARAAAGGDVAELVRVLAPDVVLTSDGGGRVRAALRPVVGADPVARFLVGLATRARGDVQVVPVLVNGEVGLVVLLVEDGTTTDVSVVVPHVDAHGRVAAVDIVRNPDKLGSARSAQPGWLPGATEAPSSAAAPGSAHTAASVNP